MVEKSDVMEMVDPLSLPHLSANFLHSPSLLADYNPFYDVIEGELPLLPLIEEDIPDLPNIDMHPGSPSESFEDDHEDDRDNHNMDDHEVTNQGALRRILIEGKAFVFKERRVNKSGEVVDSYRCYRYKRGCKVAFTIKNNEICFSNVTEHCFCEAADLRGKKRKLIETQITNLEDEMKEKSQEVALSFPGLPAKEISIRVSTLFNEKFSGIHYFSHLH